MTRRCNCRSNTAASKAQRRALRRVPKLIVCDTLPVNDSSWPGPQPTLACPDQLIAYRPCIATWNHAPRRTVFSGGLELDPEALPARPATADAARTPAAILRNMPGHASAGAFETQATLIRVRRFFRDLNPTLRGFGVIALIALIVVVLQLQRTLTALFLLAQIGFFLAIAFFVYLLWRDHRHEISMWSTRAQVVFYGSALLMVVNVAVRFWVPVGNGLGLIAFLAVFVCGGFAMWRVWRDEHSYGY